MKKNNHVNEIIALIFSVGRAFRQEASSKEADHCLSMVQLGTLGFIKENKPLMKDVANFLKVTKPTLTELINELERKKMVKRISSKNDRRSTFVEITKRGEKIFETSLKIKKKEMRGVFEKLSQKEQKSLVEILNKIINCK